MLLRELVGSAKRSTERLSDLSDTDVVGYLSDALKLLRARLGIKFATTGTGLDVDITFPASIDSDLEAIIVLQAKQIANSSSSVKATKVGDLSVQYDPQAWQRDEDFLEDLIQAFASENNLSVPSKYTVFSMNEYDLLLNPDIMIDTFERARNNFYNP